jgi:hypothetical protein
MLRMQEIAFPGFKLQKFLRIIPLISNVKLRLIFFFYFLCIFPSFISNTSIVSKHFRANLDAQNAVNGISVLHDQISKIFWGSTPHTCDHCYPPLISNDKRWLIFFNFLCVFSFIYFKYKYS